MKIVKVFTALAVTIIFAVGCSTLPPLPEEEDVGPANISIAKLQKKMKQATDPKGTFRNSTSYMMKQQLITNIEGKKDVFVIITRFQKPKKFSIVKLENGTPVTGQVINNQKAWIIDYKAEKVTAIDGRALKIIHLLFDIGNPSATLSEIFPYIKIEQCRFGPKQFYKLTCRTKDKDMAPISIYVGKSNFLVKQISFTRKADGLKYTAIMDKYNLYEGVMVSKLMTVRMNNLMQSYKTTMYKLNPKLDPKDFVPPTFKK